MRPQTLAEVAKLTAKGQSFDFCLANWLDEIGVSPTDAALKEPPELLAPTFGDLGQVQDAYLAATAEELSRMYGLLLPRWVDADERKLRRPWFSSRLAALRSTLLLESPPGFRSRNLFVSLNALSRA